MPGRILAWSGIIRPTDLGLLGVVGLSVGVIGGALAVSCIATFVTVGKGTPAPFDPPRKLVVRGPYRFVRNPMYVGAWLALCGAAIFYRSVPLLAYGVVFLFATHMFVVGYEEPTLARVFGDEYRTYCSRVRRWVPRAGAGV